MLGDYTELTFLDPYLAPIVFIFGACMGSFFNVCIHRIPRKQSIVRPRSHCPSCDTLIPWYRNIPLLSWLLLRGECADCGAKISPRYFLVELATAVLLTVAWVIMPFPASLVGMLFIGWMLVTALIDLETFFLPDSLTVGGSFVGVFASLLVPELQVHVPDEGVYAFALYHAGIKSLLGILVGSGVLLWISIIAEKVFKREALGFGDVLLLGCIGSFCGVKGTLFSLFGGAALGTAVILPLMLLERITGKKIMPRAAPEALNPEVEPGQVFDEDPLKFGIAIPFGPWLCLAAVLYMLFFKPWVHTFLEPLHVLIR